MDRTELTSAVIPRSVVVSPAEWELETAAVWLRGEHDVSSVPVLSSVLAQAIARGDANLTLDLSEVLFIDAATIGIIVETRELLRSQSRTLVIRSPSQCAQRFLDVCHRADLIEPLQIEDLGGSANAIGRAPLVTVPAINPSELLDQVPSLNPRSTLEPEPESAAEVDQTVA